MPRRELLAPLPTIAPSRRRVRRACPEMDRMLILPCAQLRHPSPPRYPTLCPMLAQRKRLIIAGARAIPTDHMARIRMGIMYHKWPKQRKNQRKRISNQAMNSRPTNLKAEDIMSRSMATLHRRMTLDGGPPAMAVKKAHRMEAARVMARHRHSLQ